LPEQRTITARSTPYRETNKQTYTCMMCGIQRAQRKGRPQACNDCRPECIRLGWIEGPKACDCGRTIKTENRDQCCDCHRRNERQERKAA
jgi:hypothetical protein